MEHVHQLSNKPSQFSFKTAWYLLQGGVPGRLKGGGKVKRNKSINGTKYILATRYYKSPITMVQLW
jgi:hypothetical protein